MEVTMFGKKMSKNPIKSIQDKIRNATKPKMPKKAGMKKMSGLLGKKGY